ncbi:MAG: homoserine O-acetyltransferase [Bacteroidetes bacterium GWF2_49_14]|nr:MAG: homoserine O-acetyltransferase [Bacteroidetes bacterium GWF2_49_14]HBB91432.1 homoserine O-acetyltransferase [Bacteroidales bacterium]
MTQLEPHIFEFTTPLKLECGREINRYQVAFHTFGRLNETLDNVIWVGHALTANSDVYDWWPGMVGPGLLMDTDKYFIICANILGSCYGTTGPLSKDPMTGKPYLLDFPLITVRDIVKIHQVLKKFLGIKKIHLGIGGSLGGQQVLEWAIQEPDLFRYIAPVATNARASAWGIAFDEAQRMALAADESFARGDLDGGSAGIRAARAMALLSYRNRNTYEKTQNDPDQDKLDGFKACSYQQYQGEKLDRRFNAYSYHTLTKSLDSQNVGRGRGGVSQALSAIKAHTIAVGISSDLLFPPEEQKLIAENIHGAEYHEIDSFYGHDGFLIEVEALTAIIKPIINQERYEN